MHGYKPVLPDCKTAKRAILRISVVYLVRIYGPLVGRVWDIGRGYKNSPGNRVVIMRVGPALGLQARITVRIARHQRPAMITIMMPAPTAAPPARNGSRKGMGRGRLWRMAR